ncbi:hypothetical protein Tco_0651838 [Tanacetum coccineum]|uniref:Uncharacterized protein n=1 Tax=Tanacetum coccineum TaxID=301880 RepID=A0ABQ4WVW2_9ASTR
MIQSSLLFLFSNFNILIVDSDFLRFFEEADSFLAIEDERNFTGSLIQHNITLTLTYVSLEANLNSDPSLTSSQSRNLFSQKLEKILNLCEANSSLIPPEVRTQGLPPSFGIYIFGRVTTSYPIIIAKDLKNEEKGKL